MKKKVESEQDRVQSVIESVAEATMVTKKAGNEGAEGAEGGPVTAGAELVFPKNFIQSARELGIETGEAIPEFVDNSWDAGANNVHIITKEVGEDLWIAVADDGCGMPPEFIPTALSFGGTGHFGSKVKIGRFGWGLPAAAVNQATRVEIYSKVKSSPFARAHLDVKEFVDGRVTRIPNAIPTGPSAEFFPFKNAESGTVVILKNTDRVRWRKASTIRSHIIKDLARVYRRFLLAGKTITVDGVPVRPFDPLMLDERCIYVDELGLGDPTIYSLDPIEFLNPSTKEKGVIRFRFSYLNWQKINESAATSGDARENGKFKTKHAIGPEGSGFYVVRDDREIVAASTLGGLISKHAVYNFLRAEISFTPVLDEAFGIQTNKSRFSICQGLKDKLEPMLKGLYATCEKRRQKESAEKQRKETSTSPTVAETIAAQAEKVLKRKPDTKNTESELQKKDGGPTATEGPQEQKVKIEMLETGVKKNLPFRIVIQHNPHGPFYWVDYLGSTSLVYVNAAHPFYTKIYERAAQTEGLKDALDLLVLTLAKAEIEAMKGDNENLKHFYNNEKIEWSTILRTYLESAP